MRQALQFLSNYLCSFLNCTVKVKENTESWKKTGKTRFNCLYLHWNLWQSGPHGTTNSTNKEQVLMPSLVGLHLQRQNKQKVSGGKAHATTTAVQSPSAALTSFQTPGLSVSINKMWQTPFAGPETVQPGTASVHTTKLFFPSGQSGLIHVASWEPSISPQIMLKQFEKLLIGKSETEHVNKHHRLLQANIIFWPCLTCKYRCNTSVSLAVSLRVPAPTRETSH